LTTTNEVDDLDSIVVAQLGRVPLVATHNGTIQLDGNSRRREVKLRDQLIEGKWTGELSGFAVYVNAQGEPRQAATGCMIRRSSAAWSFTTARTSTAARPEENWGISVATVATPSLSVFRV